MSFIVWIKEKIDKLITKMREEQEFNKQLKDIEKQAYRDELKKQQPRLAREMARAKVQKQINLSKHQSSVSNITPRRDSLVGDTDDLFKSIGQSSIFEKKKGKKDNYIF